MRCGVCEKFCVCVCTEAIMPHRRACLSCHTQTNQQFLKTLTEQSTEMEELRNQLRYTLLQFQNGCQSSPLQITADPEWPPFVSSTNYCRSKMASYIEIQNGSQECSSSAAAQLRQCSCREQGLFVSLFPHLLQIGQSRSEDGHSQGGGDDQADAEHPGPDTETGRETIGLIVLDRSLP